MRISKDEIVGAIELFVNCIYDNPTEENGWHTATLKEWMDAVYEELTTWKTENGCSYHSNENRFDGKETIMKRVKPMLIARLKELKDEGYDIKAI